MTKKNAKASLGRYFSVGGNYYFPEIYDYSFRKMKISFYNLLLIMFLEILNYFKERSVLYYYTKFLKTIKITMKNT